MVNFFHVASLDTQKVIYESVEYNYKIIYNPNNQPGDYFGDSTCVLDFNGDGHQDLAVGAKGFNNGRGTVFIYFGPNLEHYKKITSFDEAKSFGSPVRSAGNIDGSAGEELLVGAPKSTVDNLSEAGAVYMISSQIDDQMKIVASDPQQKANFGTDICISDFNKDNNYDVVIGAPKARVDKNSPASGKIYFYSLNDFLEPYLVIANPDQNNNSKNGNYGAHIVVQNNEEEKPINLVVSGIGNPVNSWPSGGKVYVYPLPINNEKIELISPILDYEQDIGPRFGMYLSASSYGIAVGASRHDLLDTESNLIKDAGAGFLFKTPGLNDNVKICRRSDNPSDKDLPFDINGYRVYFADIIKSNTCSLDLIVVSLSIFPHEHLMYVYNGDNLDDPPIKLTPLNNSSSHFANGISSGQIIKGDTEELIIGDPYYGNNQTEDYTGRVVILFFSPVDNLSVSIEKPGYNIYVNNKKIIPFFTPLIFGNLDIEVKSYDKGVGIQKVDFYIDNKLEESDDSYPYVWNWDRKEFFKHTIKIIVYNNLNTTKTEEIEVWKFL